MFVPCVPRASTAWISKGATHDVIPIVLQPSPHAMICLPSGEIPGLHSQGSLPLGRAPLSQEWGYSPLILKSVKNDLCAIFKASLLKNIHPKPARYIFLLLHLDRQAIAISEVNGGQVLTLLSPEKGVVDVGVHWSLVPSDMHPESGATRAMMPLPFWSYLHWAPRG